MDKKYIKNPKTGRLVLADGATGKKVSKMLKQEGKQIKYESGPGKSKVAKKADKKQQQRPIRPPDESIIMRLIDEPVHLGEDVVQTGAEFMAPPIDATQQQFRRALQLSKKQYQQHVAKELKQQLGQRKKMQQEDQHSKQRQKADFKKDMKQLRVKMLAKKAKQQEQKKKQIASKKKEQEQKKKQEEQKKKEQAARKRMEQSKKRADALKKKYKK